MTEYSYRATLTADPDGGWVVTFPDVPEAITHGADEVEAKANAAEALGLALRGYAAEGKALPEPQAAEGILVPVEATEAVKLAVIDAFRAEGISKTELARRLGKSENEARRILDPDHNTKLNAMQDALHALNRVLTVSVAQAA